MIKDLNDVSHRLVSSLLGGQYTLRKESILVFVLILQNHQVNNSKFCANHFYVQDLLSFDSLSRDWILKLDPNDNFRNEIINLDYPWVMTPLSNDMGNFSVYVLTVVR